MTDREAELTNGLRGKIVTPEMRSGWGVVVLGGSSGRIDIDRARLFAQRGAVSLALQWFGGEGQSKSILEIPLEIFVAATDRLIHEGCTRIAFLGVSRGAEAALLAAAYDQRIEVVVALSPSSVVWANADARPEGEAWSQRSSFTHDGHPLRFVRYDETCLFTMPRDPPVAYLDLYLKSLDANADEVAAATIPIELARAKVLLVAGGDDALWPSYRFAIEIQNRLAALGKEAVVVSHPDAGHRTLLPGEITPRSTQNLHGGSDDADAALGVAAWDAISHALG